MPEIIIYNALESVIRCVRKDLADNKEKEQETILFRLLGENIDGKPLTMNRWNFFKQAKKIFTNKNNLSVNFGYNFEVANIIALHIILPSEQAAESAIGQDEGYDIQTDNEKVTNFFTQNFQSNYQIMITSNNSSEILTVYHVLKSMLLMLVPHFEIMGLRLCKFSGNDIMFKDDLMPNGMFHKVLNISFNYELKVPQMLQKDIMKKMIFEGKIVDLSPKKDNNIPDYNLFERFVDIIVEYKQKLRNIILISGIISEETINLKDGIYFVKDENDTIIKLLKVEKGNFEYIQPSMGKIYSCFDLYYVYNGEIFLEIGSENEIYLTEEQYDNLENKDLYAKYCTFEE